MSKFWQYTLIGLGIVALFLVLRSRGQAGRLIGTAGNQFSMFLRTLQGRDATTGKRAETTL